jgi:hypothetical protein
LQGHGGKTIWSRGGRLRNFTLMVASCESVLISSLFICKNKSTTSFPGLLCNNWKLQRAVKISENIISALGLVHITWDKFDLDHLPPPWALFKLLEFWFGYGSIFLVPHLI